MEKIKVAFVFNRQRTKSPEEAEFDSPEVIEAISGALEAEFEVEQIEVTRNGSWMRRLEEYRPDVVLNTAEGFRGSGRESLAPVCIEQLGFHYAGPGPYLCFLTLDKFLTKQRVLAAGVPTPESFFIQDVESFERLESEMPFPVFAKPNFEGSSKGISDDSICRGAKELRRYLKKNIPIFPDGILVEGFVEGRDVTVPYVSGLGKDGVLDPVEYFRKSGVENWIYDFNLKNLTDDVDVRCPASFDENTLKTLVDYMGRVVSVLSVTDMARADFRVTPSGEVYFIEINALPSLQPDAGLFEASKRLGLDYGQTLRHIIRQALARKKMAPPSKTARSMRMGKPVVGLVHNLKRKRFGEEGYEQESEFDSQTTINAIGEAIEKNGYELRPIEMTPHLSDDLRGGEVDVVFNIAEGHSGRARESQAPAICDLLGIEHTGGDAACMAITLDKLATGRILSSEGINVPRSTIVRSFAQAEKLKLRYPVIVKPNWEGTSKGIFEDSVCTDWEQAAVIISRFGENAAKGLLCEEFIDGREFTVGLLGNQTLGILGPAEVVFKKRDGGARYPVYSFEAKQAENPTDNEFYKIECPADLTPAQMRRISSFARKCFKIIGCRDVGRIDFRMTPDDKLHFIEINPLPGLSPGYSDLAVMAERSGMKYEELIGGILKPAVFRWRKQKMSRKGGL